MTNFIKPTNFIIQELVPSEVYSKFGEKSWMFLSRNILSTLAELRILFDKPITVNTWKWGGRFEQRGFRTWHHYSNLQQYVESFSQHKFGNALDFDVKNINADKAREYIRRWKNQGCLPNLTRIETGVSWVHIDCANVAPSNFNRYGLVEFAP